MKGRTQLVGAFVAMVVLVTISGTSWGAMLAHESFDYTTGTQGTVGIQLSGQGDATDGWAGGWTGATAWQVVPADMSYTGVPTTGGRLLNSFDNWSNVFRTLDVAGTFSDYAETNGDGDTVIGKDGTSIWVSALMMGPTSTSAQGMWLGFADDYFNNYSATMNVGACKGVKFGPDIYAFARAGGAYSPAADSGYDLSGPDASLLLIEFVFGAGNNDTINLYVNEDAEGDPSTYVADATITGLDLGFYRILMGQADTSNSLYGVDEIRIGETAADVLPNATPEPATMSLLLLGGLVTVCRRRSRA